MREVVNTIIKEIYLNPFFIVMAIFCILSIIFYKKLRGFMGELWVKKELNKLPKDQYLILNNIMIKAEEETHQIDHIVISNFGIFVIEMKNFYGLIVGNQYKNKWIQYLGNNKYYFNNPIHQNYGHIQSLKECLQLDESAFISIVCFSNQAKLKVESKNKIVQVSNIKEYITSYKEEKLNINLNDMKEKLLNLNITDIKSRNKHVKDIKDNIKGTEIKVNNLICPKCGANLVKRIGKYGEFVGCSNYPNCKYTQKVN